MRLNEINVVGLAIHMDKLPQKYKAMKNNVIGRGATSIVYSIDGDDTHVLMLTRDAMKIEWMNRTGLGTVIDEIEVPHPNRGVQEKPVYVLKVDKLFPLSKENLKKVRKIMKLINSEIWANISGKLSKGQIADRIVQKLEMDFADQESIIEFFNFIMDYHDSQFNFDPLQRNFMQDAEGKIIASDLVIDKELLDAIHAHKQAKQPQTRWEHNPSLGKGIWR